MTLLASDDCPTATGVETVKSSHNSATETGLTVDEITALEQSNCTDRLQNGTVNKFEMTYSEVDVQNQSVPKKNRLVSVDSGFGSFGPSELNVVAITSEASTTAVPYPTRAVSAFASGPPAKAIVDKGPANDSECQLEKRDQLAPLEVPVRRLSDSNCNDKIREFRKNRTTTLTTEEPNVELDVRLINRYDGLKDVICYLDEDGAPKVREKSRRKSTLRQELQSRNLGASLDNDSMRGIQKKPSCVSFSRLCKKFKESFLSKCQRTQ